ncbi:MAG: tyramine oxidase [Bacteroidetes bacterium]|nr:tyramine oxidase [Bacteroidota bacterium]
MKHQNQLFLAAALFLPFLLNAQAHPLDPLSAKEIKQAVQILKDNKAITGRSYFNIINLKEAPKSEILNYKPGDSFRREAFLSFHDYAKPGMTEAIVDLKTSKIISIKDLANVTSMGLVADDSLSDAIVRADPAWQAALRKHGIPIDSVIHRGIFPGDLGLAPVGHHEQLVFAQYKGSHIDIEGLIAYTDLTSGKILKIVDDHTGFDKRIDPGYFDEDNTPSDKDAGGHVVITQPNGSEIKMDGMEITWRNWRLRYGIDNREGLVLYNIRLFDKEKKAERPVMYRASMPEMFVPYGAPDLLHAAYNFFDAGEYRLGQNVTRPLTPGADAPENAIYRPATLHRDNGEPYILDPAVAIYEEYGGVLWRHGSVSRRATNLVIKYFTTIENYDYGFTWRFKEDGTIDVDVELTGIVEVQGVEDNATHRYGTLVYPHVEAINHQHFFVFRLDMDVDGSQHNAVMEMNAKLAPEKENPYNNAFTVEHTHFMNELEAQRSVNYESNRCWHIENTQVRNTLGQSTGYMLMPGGQAKTFMPPGSLIRKKAGFLDHQFWVTPYSDTEKYPAGAYPASNKVYDGLPQWTAANRSISNNDIVLWYVAGITHIVRPEEWPVMPVHHLGFTLMPFGFFSSNPTLKTP